MDFLKQLKVIDKLQLPKDQYLIWGSGPLAIRNLRDARDIDIVVSASLWKYLTQKYEPRGPKKNLIKLDPNIEIWSDLLNLTDRIDELMNDREMIHGYPFLKLSHTLEWKKFWNSAKDPKDIALIDQYLALNKS